MEGESFSDILHIQEHEIQQRVAELERANRALQAELADCKQALAAARKNEQFKQALLDALPGHIAVLDATGTIIAVNQSWRRFAEDNPPVYGNSAEGANYFEVCDKATGDSAEGAQHFAAGIRAVLIGTQEHFATVYPCHSSDQQRWFIGHVTQCKYDGQTYVVVTHEHITGYRQIEQALFASEDRFRRLVEAIPIAIGIRQGLNIAYMNAAAEALTGYTPQELQGAVLWKLMHPDSHAWMHERMHTWQRGEERVNRFEIKIITATGTMRWLDVTALPIEFGGEPSILGVALDITSQKEAEEARVHSYAQMQSWNEHLQQTSELLQTIFDTMNDGLLLLDSNGTVLVVNRALAKLLGRDPQNILRQSWQTLCHPYAPPPPPAVAHFPGLQALQTLRDGRRHRWRESFSPATGVTRILDIQALPIGSSNETNSPQQGTQQVMVHIVDVTESTKLEALLLENARLTQGRKLTEIVAHEVNTPLQTILLALEMILDTTREELEDFVVLVQHEIKHIGAILHQLVQTYDAVPQVYDRVDINHVIEQVLLMLEVSLTKSHVRLEKQLPADLPPVPGFADQLEQAVLNLILYAIAGMPDGGILRVQTRIEKNTYRASSSASSSGLTFSGLIVEVTSEGKKSLPEISSQLPLPLLPGNGHANGLGLYIAQRIITRHHGNLHAAFQPSVGTTFTIKLPTV